MPKLCACRLFAVLTQGHTKLLVHKGPTLNVIITEKNHSTQVVPGDIRYGLTNNFIVTQVFHMCKKLCILYLVNYKKYC